MPLKEAEQNAFDLEKNLKYAHEIREKVEEIEVEDV